MTDGLYRYTPSTGRLRVYRHDPADASTISQNSVASLLVDSEGVVWVGTYDQGLCAFSKRTGRFTAYRKQPGGLSDNQVHSIYEDAVGYLWIGTYSSGIDCFDRRTGRFVNYRDGVPAACSTTSTTSSPMVPTRYSSLRTTGSASFRSKRG